MGHTIALVDDDRNILTGISMALEREGFKVQTYIDGESALIGLTRNPPDLAILDPDLTLGLPAANREGFARCLGPRPPDVRPAPGWAEGRNRTGTIRRCRPPDGLSYRPFHLAIR